MVQKKLKIIKNFITSNSKFYSSSLEILPILFLQVKLLTQEWGLSWSSLYKKSYLCLKNIELSKCRL